MNINIILYKSPLRERQSCYLLPIHVRLIIFFARGTFLDITNRVRTRLIHYRVRTWQIDKTFKKKKKNHLKVL